VLQKLINEHANIGAANITCRQNTNVDKEEEQTVIDLQEPV